MGDRPALHVTEAVDIVAIVVQARTRAKLRKAAVADLLQKAA